MKAGLFWIFALSVASAVGAETGPWNSAVFPKADGLVSAIAASDGRLAVGFTSGKIVLQDPDLRGAPAEIAGDRDGLGQILSLTWFRGGLWIASRKGLSRYDQGGSGLGGAPSAISPAMRAGAKIARETGGHLVCASSKRVGAYSGEGKDSWREWEMPSEIEPTGVLRVGPRIFVGTDSGGLLVLDTATERWTRFGVADGMGSNLVVGLEWVGGEVMVGTSTGIDALDLAALRFRRVADGMSPSWMTQVNGSLYVSSIDGLVAVDSRSRARRTIELPPGDTAEGDILFHRGRLFVGCRSAVVSRTQSTLLGSDSLERVPDGFRLRLPAPLPDSVGLHAWLRLPEWPALEVPLSVSGSERREYVVVLPPEAKGKVHIDLMAVAGGVPLEIRSMESDGDRSRPVLVVDEVPATSRLPEIAISGAASGIGPLSLELSPSGRSLPIGRGGVFRHRVALSRGENRFGLRLRDGNGRILAREIAVLFDDARPEIGAVVTDSVEEGPVRLRIPFRDESGVEARLVPPIGARASVFDSFVVFEASVLRSGDNSWKLVLVDRAGNASACQIRVRRTGAPPASPAADETTGSSRSAVSGAVSGVADRGIHVVRYRLRKNENLRHVAGRFYGDERLEWILIRWNGYRISAEWRNLPPESVVEVPFWEGFEWGALDPELAMKAIPWDSVRSDKETR